MAPASAKRVSELQGLSFEVICTFSFEPRFFAKTRNPSVPDLHFEGFAILPVRDFFFFFLF